MIKSWNGLKPQIDPSCFVAETADIIGSVVIGEGSSVWYKAVLRGDVDGIVIGRRSNVQDTCVVHTHHGLPAIIGDDVTIGHSAIIHACTIEDNCLIGMGATILDGAVIGEGSIIGAGAVVPPGMQVPPRSQVVGIPAKVVKTLTQERVDGLIEHSRRYAELAQTHKAEQEE